MGGVVPFPVGARCRRRGEGLGGNFWNNFKDNTKGNGSGQECPLHTINPAWAELVWVWDGEDLFAFSGGEDFQGWDGPGGGGGGEVGGLLCRAVRRRR